MTIRQDLQCLEEGQVTWGHGGALLNAVPQQVVALTLQHGQNMEKKGRFGALAANLVAEREALILASRSITTEVALRCGERRGLTVVTTALNIALTLGAVPRMAVHMGGAVPGPDALPVGRYVGGLLPEFPGQ